MSARKTRESEMGGAIPPIDWSAARRAGASHVRTPASRRWATKARNFGRDLRAGLALAVVVFALWAAWHYGVRALGFSSDQEAVVKIVSAAGCDAAALVGVGPVKMTDRNYWRHNDADGDGSACEERLETRARAPAPAYDRFGSDASSATASPRVLASTRELATPDTSAQTAPGAAQ